MPIVTDTITTTKTTGGTVAYYTSPIALRDNQYFNVSVWGTFVGTVALQRSFDGGTTWLTVSTYTAATETTKYEPEPALYRMGTAISGYTSGTISVRLGAA